MKKLFFYFLLSTSLIACKNNESATAASTAMPEAVEKIYKPTYTDNFKMGNPENITIIEKLHQAIIAKDFAVMGDWLADDVVFQMDDGSTIEGKAVLLDFMEQNFSQITLENYSVGVSMSVVGENGHEWVLMWDEADLVMPDGTSQKVEWMDAFRLENGKVLVMNGFVKSPKE